MGDTILAELTEDTILNLGWGLVWEKIVVSHYGKVVFIH